MRIKAICASTVLAAAVFTGLTMGYQKIALADQGRGKLQDPNKWEGKLQDPNKWEGKLQDPNKWGVKPEAPTPALLPGLIGIGVGVLRKRKAEQNKVDR